MSPDALRGTASPFVNFHANSVLLTQMYATVTARLKCSLFVRPSVYTGEQTDMELKIMKKKLGTYRSKMKPFIYLANQYRAPEVLLNEQKPRWPPTHMINTYKLTKIYKFTQL